MRTCILLCAAAVILCSCGRGIGRVDTDEARHLVERYNKVVIEAYRRADAKLADQVAGPEERRKLTGLIGVRQDMGVTLDSRLLQLEMVTVDQDDDGQWLEVRTREKWHYLDRKIGTGEQVGEDSTDTYEMIYQFARDRDRWVVDKIKFAAPPEVGRKKPLWAEGMTHPNGGMIPPQSGMETNRP